MQRRKLRWLRAVSRRTSSVARDCDSYARDRLGFGVR